MRLARPQGVLFDLDGTLTHREQSVVVYAAAFAADFADALGEISRVDLDRVLIGCDRNGYNPDRAGDIVRGLPWKARPAEADVARHWRDVLPEHCVLQRGAEATLEGLRRREIRLGVVTNGPVSGQTAKLERLGIRGDFDALVISDAVGIAKPDARIFELALNELGVRAQDCWFVGDHPANDVLGAAAAGLTAFWLPGGTPWPDAAPAPPYRIDTLGDLLARVDGLPPGSPRSE